MFDLPAFERIDPVVVGVGGHRLTGWPVVAHRYWTA